MAIPTSHPSATHWGIERRSTDPNTGQVFWTFVSLPRGQGLAGPRKHWFPIGSYTEQHVRALGAGAVVRLTFVPGPSGRTKLGVVELDCTEPAAEPATKAVAPHTLHAPDIVAAPTPPPILAVPPGQVPPRPIFRGEPAPTPVDNGLERCHYLAIQDTDRVVQAICTMSATQTQAVTAMASAMIATAAGDRDQWKGLAMQAISAMQAPRPEIAALGQKLDTNSAQLAALAQENAQLRAQLEEEDDEPPQLPPAEPTDGQRMIAALGPIAKELAPRIVDKLWPSDNPAAPQPRPPAGDTEAEP